MTRNRWFLPFALAFLVIGLALGAGTAQAGSAVLGNSGWTAEWNDAPNTDFFVALQDIGTGADRVLFKKVATFGPDRVDAATNVILPIEIVFRQTTRNAKDLVVVNSEFITNNTGKNWNSFQFSIVDGTTGTIGQSNFNKAATGNFNDPFGFNILPFTDGTYSSITSADQSLSLTGGVVADGQTWTPGGGGTLGQLVINAKPTSSGAFRTFVFEEQPNTTPTTIIPLPAAAWTGLSGLIGLGLVSAAKKARRLFH